MALHCVEDQSLRNVVNVTKYWGQIQVKEKKKWISKTKRQLLTSAV